MATHKPINILEAFAAAPPPLDYVLPNMVAGTVGALVSPGGAGKSMLALQLAAQIAGGPDLLEVGELPTGPVIYLPAEDPPTAIHHRLHALGAHLSAEERQAVADGLLIQPLIGSLPNIMAPEWFDVERAAEGRRTSNSSLPPQPSNVARITKWRRVLPRTGSTVLATSSSSKYLKKRAYSGSVIARSETVGAAAAAGLSADMKTAPAASPADPPKRLRRERDFSDIEHLI